MMKYSQYSTYPEKIIQYDKNSYLINYDIKESTQIEEEKELKIYKCKYIIVPKLNKEEIVNALIQEQYSETQELNILRKSEGEDFYNLQQYTKKANIIADKILNPEDELKQAKNEKLIDIDNYDKSDEVNSFRYQGKIYWLPRETRVSVMNTANILKNSNVEYMDLWLDTTHVQLSPDSVIQMLTQLEQYALGCYNKTAQHKLNVLNLSTVDEVKSYDYKSGYPKKLEFVSK